MLDARDDMGIRHHELGGDPARALDAETAGDAGDPDHARCGRRDIRIAGDGRLRRGDLRRRPDEDAERIDAFERLEQTLGRKLLVDPGEDLRLLDRARSSDCPGR